MHPVPMDGTDGKVANEPSRVRVSVVEPSGTWTFGLGKNRDLVSSTCTQSPGRRGTSTRTILDRGRLAREHFRNFNMSTYDHTR